MCINSKIWIFYKYIAPENFLKYFGHFLFFLDNMVYLVFISSRCKYQYYVLGCKMVIIKINDLQSLLLKFRISIRI